MRTEINCCHVPTPAKRSDAEIYESLRGRLIKAHCAAGRGSHHCCGRITIDRTSITLQCPLCGDARNLIEAVAAPQDGEG